MCLFFYLYHNWLTIISFKCQTSFKKEKKNNNKNFHILSVSFKGSKPIRGTQMFDILEVYLATKTSFMWIISTRIMT